ncbi:MAG: STAS domain-containing protein [Myxococcales bacterium]|nr:STAS domain-containing protein [Myxococcales bacterium]
MSEPIVDLERRLHALEEAIVATADGEFRVVEVSHDDPLGAIEVGVNALVEALRDRIDQVEQTNRALGERVELIERQREAIQALSVPVLQLWEQVIAMPLIGVIDSRRCAAIMDTLLGAIRRGGARFAILDITGVELVDTRTAAFLIDIVRAARLLGSVCILTGVQPSVAQSLVLLEINLDELPIRRDLQAGLRTCLTMMEEGG